MVKFGEWEWTTTDPIKDGSDWWTYCGNDPVNYVDPLGLQPNHSGAGNPYANLIQNPQKMPSTTPTTPSDFERLRQEALNKSNRGLCSGCAEKENEYEKLFNASRAPSYNTTPPPYDHNKSFGNYKIPPEYKRLSEGVAVESLSDQFKSGIIFGRYEINFLYGEGMIRGEGEKSLIDGGSKGIVGFFAKGSVVNVGGKIGLGDENNSVSLKFVGDVLTASGKAGAGLKPTFAGIMLQGLISIVSGRGTIEIVIDNWEIEIGASGYAGGIGGSIEAGYFSNEGFKIAVRAVPLSGFGGLVRVKPPMQPF